MKGKTIIELKDVKTGAVQRVEHGNTFQSAVLSELFKTYGAFNLNFLEQHRNENELWKILVGGLLIFDDTITEGTFYPPQDINMVGNASYNVLNSGDPNEMGSWNESESSVSDNEIIMTYDFTTSQANGRINSIALTSAQGGYVGIGNSSETIRSSRRSIYGTGQTLNASHVSSYSIIAFDGEYQYEVTLSENTLTVRKKYLNSKGVDLILGGAGETYTETYNIGLSESYSGFAKINENKIICYKEVSDTFKVIIVDIKTRNTSSAVIIPKISGLYNYGFVSGIDDIQMWQEYSSDSKNYISIYDGNAGQWISEVEWTTWKTSRTAMSTIFKMGDRYYYVRSTGVDDEYGQVLCEKDGELLATNGCDDGSGYQLFWNSNLKLLQGGYYHTIFYHPSLYLATINNLEEEIVKDNTKTMKITYVLTRR